MNKDHRLHSQNGHKILEPEVSRPKYGTFKDTKTYFVEGRRVTFTTQLSDFPDGVFVGVYRTEGRSIPYLLSLSLDMLESKDHGNSWNANPNYTGQVLQIDLGQEHKNRETSLNLLKKAGIAI